MWQKSPKPNRQVGVSGSLGNNLGWRAKQIKRAIVSSIDHSFFVQFFGTQAQVSSISTFIVRLSVTSIRLWSGIVIPTLPVTRRGLWSTYHLSTALETTEVEMMRCLTLDADWARHWIYVSLFVSVLEDIPGERKFLKESQRIMKFE